MASILLLEPDKQLAKSYQAALHKAGHTVHWQTNAQSALTVLDDHAPQLVILELHLANHNGVEFLYEMRSYPDCDHVPVVLHTMVEPEHPGLGHDFWPQLGIQEYLYKPRTTLAQLVERVNRLTLAQAA
ncbi:MAG: response regulator [Candidatus Saccharibacteria bacterium]